MTASITTSRNAHRLSNGKRVRPARGFAAVLAMVFLVLAVTLSLGLYSMANTNTQSASNLADSDRARNCAESGLRWAQYEMATMPLPKTTIGNITASVAQTLWPSVTSAVQTQLKTMTNKSEQTATVASGVLTTSFISTDADGGKFQLTMQQHPLSASDTLDARTVRITSLGSYGAATRTMCMDFSIVKQVNYAVVGMVEIQLGKNTLVEGNIGMATPNLYPPFISLSDFKHLDSQLDTDIGNFETFLASNHQGYDGRISTSNATEYAAASKAGYKDLNGDGYIDEYDIFLKDMDSNHDQVVTQAEFTNPSTGKSYDPAMLSAIDSLGGPLYTGDPIRAGYQDGQIANNDGYAKIRGQVVLAASQSGWAANLASQGSTLSSMFAGPIIPQTPTTPPVVFGAPSTSFFALSPTDFDTSGYASESGPANGTSTKTATTLTNESIATSLANDGTVVNQSPYGSTSWEATYQRPVFQNMTFNNCSIPLGVNALFEGCTFNGVTFVNMTTNITNSSGQTTTSSSDGATWSQSMISKGAFSTSTVLTTKNSNGFNKGNNLRFDNCTINGPLVSTVPTAYTHFTNSWEFTGSTVFNNTADQTATIFAPQTNIEMGSFTDPTKAPSTLTGVVVVGNIDIRGETLVDGSIIVTGNGAANTTLGWFGNSDSSSDPNSVPTNGWGKVNIRYNPYRALPNGINAPIQVLANPATYHEGT